MNDNLNSSKKVARIIIILSAVIGILSLYILLVIELPHRPLAGQGDTFKDDVQIGGAFTLTDQNGNEFNSEMMNGKLSLIYFGFTYCPDVCPTSLQKLSNVLVTLEKYQIDILPIFITLDRARDTPAVMKEYLSHFHPKFIGLTGGEERIKKVADLYKVFYAKAGKQNHEKEYMIDHSSFVYLMDKKGKYMKHFYMSSTPEEIIEYIRINGK